MAPGRYTGLFFLDDATALAAGHRPCAECRREAYNLFTAIWGSKADAIDDVLHRERLQRLHPARLEDLPDGAFVLEDDAPFLVLGDELMRWTLAGYTERRARRRGKTRLITPLVGLESFVEYCASPPQRPSPSEAFCRDWHVSRTCIQSFGLNSFSTMKSRI